jgi:hypothetical protein
MYACGLGFPFVHESESITALSRFSRSITLSPSVFHPGLPDSFETDVDSDGDSVEDFLDADSDNDSVPDAMEGGFDSGAYEGAKKCCFCSASWLSRNSTSPPPSDTL